MTQNKIDEIMDMYIDGVQLYDLLGGKVFEIKKWEEDDAYLGEFYVNSENYSFLFLIDIQDNDITD